MLLNFQFQATKRPREREKQHLSLFDNLDASAGEPSTTWQSKGHLDWQPAAGTQENNANQSINLIGAAPVGEAWKGRSQQRWALTRQQLEGGGDGDMPTSVAGVVVVIII